MESERLEKINAVTSKSDVAQVSEHQEKQQQELLENTIKKVDAVSEKREQKLQELKDKLKAREEHAAKVRLRKKLRIPTQEELAQYEAAAAAAAADTPLDQYEATADTLGQVSLPESRQQNADSDDVTES